MIVEWQLLDLKNIYICEEKSLASSRLLSPPSACFSKVWLVGIWECEELIMDRAGHFCWLRPHTPHTLRTFTAQKDCLFFLCYGVRLDAAARQPFAHWC